MDKPYFVHPTSIADEGCEIGKGTRIWHFSHVMSGAVIGEDCNIGEHVFVESGVRLGNHVKVKNNISLYAGLVCEDGVFLGPASVYTNVVNPRSLVPRKDEFRETHIGRGASIGAGAVIVCGHKIGKYAFVGAGSVVTRDVPDYAVVYGNPARVKGYMCECGEMLNWTNNHAVCPKCSKRYHQEEDGTVRPSKEGIE